MSEVNLASTFEIWDIDRIKPYDKNSKLHDPDQVEKIANQIRENGFDVPIVVDAEGVIIKGHGRRLASMKLGLKRVPVIVRSDLSPTQVRAARIADNKVAEGGHDQKILKLEIADLVKSDGEFDFGSMLGFDERDLKKLMPKTFGDPGYNKLADGPREIEGFVYEQTHQVIVTVSDEAAQFSLIERLRDEGLDAKPMSM